MHISHQEIAPDLTVIAIVGAVMWGSESEQIPTLVRELWCERKRTLVFDLTGVTKIDSTGIGRFLASYNEVAATGGTLLMAGARPAVWQAFHVCRLDTVLLFYPSVEKACQAGSRSSRTPTAS